MYERFFFWSLLCSPGLQLIYKKYSTNSNIVKYYNFK